MPSDDPAKTCYYPKYLHLCLSHCHLHLHLCNMDRLCTTSWHASSSSSSSTCFGGIDVLFLFPVVRKVANSLLLAAALADYSAAAAAALRMMLPDLPLIVAVVADYDHCYLPKQNRMLQTLAKIK